MSNPPLEIVALYAEYNNSELVQVQSMLKADYPDIILHHCLTVKDAIKKINSTISTSITEICPRPFVVLTKLGQTDEDAGHILIKTIRKFDKRIFIILHSHKASNDPDLRYHFASMGTSMITEHITQIQNVLKTLISLIKLTVHSLNTSQTYTCPICQWPMSFDQLYDHIPLYHTNDTSIRSAQCIICQRNVRNYPVHLREDHTELHSNKAIFNTSAKERVAAPLYAFSLVVCQRKSDQKFLVVQESGAQGFWLPGGRVELGEHLIYAAKRETFEEAGVKVNICGLLRFEYTPSHNSNRLRVIFYAEPENENDCDAKTIPDYESYMLHDLSFPSYGAMWVTYEQIEECSNKGQLRSQEPLKWFLYIKNGGLIHPLSILNKE
ncbi:unnamed protein product [Didymodactylos carnosus]|uniref:Nudix hydrolase domain-containing protein n=2 Tax=Didymodactylos carnosus TaxID=1234261 RepID=A0A8S2E246_9BILA|nr:unnamed protein product [Didymodactylos carnosus]CAF3863355.1 unnamed protein product [Didymodactylos carnosus]